MAVIDISNPDPDWYLSRAIREEGQDCFWCGKELAPVAVYWSGPHGLFFHVACAREFSLALLYDSQRAEALVLGQKIDAGMASAVAAAEREPVFLRRRE